MYVLLLASSLMAPAIETAPAANTAAPPYQLAAKKGKSSKQKNPCAADNPPPYCNKKGE